MAIQLAKGQRIDIGLQRLEVVLRWEANPVTAAQGFDLDLSAFLLAPNGQIPTEEHFVFYNNPESPDGALKTSGDDRVGGTAEVDGEVLNVDLARLDPRIEQIVFAVTIHDALARSQNFGLIRNSLIRITDSFDGAELCKYELDEDFSVETGVEFGRIYKSVDVWRFEALGVGVSGGLQTLVNRYAKKFA